MKTCTVCKLPKEENEFYFDDANQRYTSKCCDCLSKFNVLYRAYKREGKKLTTKEFRDKKLYLYERQKYTVHQVHRGGKRYAKMS